MHLTGMWLLEEQPFKFKAINTNPLIILIKDEIGEQVKIKLTIMVKPPEVKSASSTQEKTMLELGRQGGLQLRKTLGDSMKSTKQVTKLDTMT
jgi:hypothetical protein